MRENARLDRRQRDRGVDDFIALAGAVDGILQSQSAADAEYFLGNCARSFDPVQRTAVGTAFLRAYRWQYIVSGAENERFREILGSMTDREQAGRIAAALAPIADFTQPAAAA